MKNTISYFILGAVLLTTPLALYAETNETVKLTSQSGAQVEVVGIADLGVTQVGTLPTSPWYFLKEWKRGVRQLFTFSEVKKNALAMQVTNEKLAEALAIEEVSPPDATAFREALLQYAKAETALEARIARMKDDKENAKAKELFVRLDEHSIVRSALLQQVSSRWNNDPYAEDAMRTTDTETAEGVAEREAITRVVKGTQSTIVNSWAAVIERGVDVEAKATAQLTRAESEFNLLKAEIAKLDIAIAKETGAIAIREQGVRKAEIAIDEPGALRMAPLHSGIESAKYAPTRIDNTPARLSTNMTIERQTHKRDFGDRMKAGLEQAGGMLAQGRVAFTEKKFGEAFGHGRGAEMLAVHMRRAISEFAIKEQGVKSVSPLHENAGIEMTNPIHETKDQPIKVCHQSATETCDNGTGSERPVAPPVKVEPTAPPTATKPTLPTACTAEAKVCPDGSSVGRTGPRCEFSECPAPKPTGMICAAQYDPVCGADGKTYGNSCEASAAGVAVKAKDECNAPADMGTTRTIDAR